MKISKSKSQLAWLLIEAGVKQFPDGAEWATQDGDDGRVFFYEEKPFREIGNDFWGVGNSVLTQGKAPFGAVIPNWHQTRLSRAEFDQIVAESAEQSKPDANGWIEWKGGECPVDGDLDVSVKVCGESGIGTGKAKSWSWRHYGDGADIIAYRLHKPEQDEPQYCESVTRAIPEPVAAPTLDQLLQDYRNAADFAAAKQAEADEAVKMRDERWKAAQARACELDVHISVELAVDAEMREPEPVITDWRDLKIGDVIEYISGLKHENIGRVGTVIVIDHKATDGMPIGMEFHDLSAELCDVGWPEEWRFIRRP